MAPATLEQCQHEIDRLRDNAMDFDELFVDAIDPDTGNVVERFYCKFRPPFRALVQDHDLLQQDASKTQQKWRYRFVIPDVEATLVQQFHAFTSQHTMKGMNLEPSLMQRTL